jgi:hypothetical protein
MHETKEIFLETTNKEYSKKEKTKKKRFNTIPLKNERDKKLFRSKIRTMQIYNNKTRETNEKRKTLLGGLEPPTFRLTAERANQLRHKSTWI